MRENTLNHTRFPTRIESPISLMKEYTLNDTRFPTRIEDVYPSLSDLWLSVWVLETWLLAKNKVPVGTQGIHGVHATSNLLVMTRGFPAESRSASWSLYSLGFRGFCRA